MTRSEKFWSGIVGALIIAWLVGSGLFAVLRPQPSPILSDADYQAAAALMRDYDAHIAAPGALLSQDPYVAELREAMPKCVENLVQVVYALERAAAGLQNTTSYQMLTMYNSSTSKRVDASKCTDEILLGASPTASPRQ